MTIRTTKEHHSTGDWDFDGTNWQLDTSQYTSAPTSLNTNGGSSLIGLIKTSVVPIDSVKEGAIETQVRLTTITIYKAEFATIFRYQDANNYYYVLFSYNYQQIQFHRVKAGVDTTLKTTAFTVTKDTWYLIRVTFWNDAVGLVIRFERYSSGWTIIDEAYDVQNNWNTIGGRIGFRFFTYQASMYNLGWIDDTKIYGAT